MFKDSAWDRWIAPILWVIFTVALFFAMCSQSQAATVASYIPRDAYRYQADLIREARAVYGMDAPIAMLAGQIHQESRWNRYAKSAYAAGLTQFTPDTAVWISSTFKELGKSDVYDPRWAIRALARYDKLLYDQNKGASECDRWAFALTGYNGGQGWNNKDKRIAKTKGLDPLRYWGQVETVNSGRRADFFKENRSYPKKILLQHQAQYVSFSQTTTKVCIQ